MILVIGRRFGFLIPFFVVLSEWGVHTFAEAVFGNQYFENHAWTWGVGLLPGAVVCWFLGQILRVREAKLEDDPKTGQQPIPGSAAYARYSMRQINAEAAINNPPDSFFFLQMFMWGPILAVVGVIILLVGCFS